jgi:hypothetical protein
MTPSRIEPKVGLARAIFFVYKPSQIGVIPGKAALLRGFAGFLLRPARLPQL